MKLPIIGILSGVALATLGISSAAQAAILLPPLTPGTAIGLRWSPKTGPGSKL